VIELVLVRHAQPDWQPGGRAVDHPELSAHGRRQAEAVAEALAGERFDHCYTSTLQRAIETAEFVSRRTGARFAQCSWLDELRLPTLEGRTADQVERFFAGARARDLEKWWEGMPGGESFRHMYERVASGIQTLLEGTHGMRAHDNSGYHLWHPPEGDQRRILGQVVVRQEALERAPARVVSELDAGHVIGDRPFGLSGGHDTSRGHEQKLGVGVDEGKPDPLRQPAADRRLARPHHADEHDRAPPERRVERGLLRCEGHDFGDFGHPSSPGSVGNSAAGLRT